MVLTNLHTLLQFYTSHFQGVTYQLLENVTVIRRPHPHSLMALATLQ